MTYKLLSIAIKDALCYDGGRSVHQIILEFDTKDEADYIYDSLNETNHLCEIEVIKLYK